ncbi:MAG: phenylalanyl-tRNA synthetase beta chain [Comamonadaceae bacterium]|nr:MAG: phenylalanyl-tRNA synthetase beta chain [Comamonadaceae bacterium]
MPQASKVSMRVARAAKVLGMPLTQEQCVKALTGLGLPVVEGAGVVEVTAPSFRFDLQIEEDLIEEVARMIGFHHLPQTPPNAPITAKIRPENQRSGFAVRRTLAGLGYQETINFSFVEERWEHELAGNPNPIKLLNPIASQMSVMRSSLLGSLLQVLKFNQDRKAQRVRVFELGRVFLRDASISSSDTTVQGFDQPMKVAGLAVGSVNVPEWGCKERAVDFYDVKGDLEALFAPTRLTFESAQHPAMHPGRCARVLCHGKPVGFVGELHPKWRQTYDLVQAPVLFEVDLDAVLNRQVPKFTSVPRFQAVERDIAVLVNESVTHDALMHAIWSAQAQDVLRDAVLFDIYRPKTTDTSVAQLSPSEKSMAVRLILNSDETALTEQQIEATVAAVVASLTEKVGARQRV